MNDREWLANITSDNPAEISRKTGIPKRTVHYQIERGTFSIENILAIAEAYECPPLRALIETGHVDSAWEKVPDIVGALRLASDDQLTDEILRRLQLGSTAYDTPVNELIHERSNVSRLESGARDTSLRYAAKREIPEPEEGDDDYGDGA